MHIQTNHWGWNPAGVLRWVKGFQAASWGTEMHPAGQKCGDEKVHRPRVKLGPLCFGEFVGMLVTDPGRWRKVFGGYLSYVLRHKWFVLLECCKMGMPVRGALHDLSKFLPSEFVPYAMHFYGKIDRGRDETGYYKPTDTGDRQFDEAWFLHQKRNPHHWQFWTHPDDADAERALVVLEMPMPVRKEMVCDWRGAGRAQGTPDVLAWYEKNGHKMVLGPATRHWVEKEIGARRDR